MNDRHIRLRTVYELRLDESNRPIRYFIPAYQRGYRWTSTQVRQLLDDLRDFTRRKNPQPEEYYCLQPLVLMPGKDGAYEVVDGQQRLTTLLLILRHLNDRAGKKYQLPLYALEYATRRDLLPFLENPTDEVAASNIDFSHIAGAMKTIEDWFGGQENEVRAIEDAFLNKAKVIWFQLATDESPVAAFTRLNVGKIALTNGELIRALFLRNTTGEEAQVPGSASAEKAKARRLQIAYEWDLVEKALQAPAFWAFLRNEVGQGGSRIDFLFDLVAREQGMKPGMDDYATFNHFSEKLSPKLADKSLDPAEAWLEVKKVCMLLSEWFEDRRLFHLVGFLIWDEMDINELRNRSAGSRKSDLKDKFRAIAVERTFGESAPAEPEALRSWIAERLDRLTYPRDREQIRSVLLLFNLATLLKHQQSNIRFHFESFKTARWDIEHVRSVAATELGSPKLQTDWLEQTQRYLNFAAQDAESVALQTKIKAHLALPAKDGVAAFEPLYGEVLKHFHEDDGGEPDNSIANLALLDQDTNRSYKNAVFPVKRQRVLKLDEHGVFVPHCTRNVFLKCYSPQVDHTMYWTQGDRDGYRQELINTIHTFII
jgi:hypothetical protein